MRLFRGAARSQITELQFVVKSNNSRDVLSFPEEYPGADEPVINSYPKPDLLAEAAYSMSRQCPRLERRESWGDIRLH
jgi:hypothetical protein